jgi:sec-independent protein translocase protein TatB
VFGLSFPELCVLLLVAMVVLGPKELPRYLRRAGQLASRLRRLATEMREKSGIDEVLRTEGLDREIAEFRRLARGEILGMTSAVRAVANATRINPPITYTPPPAPELPAPLPALVESTSQPLRDETYEHEYPRDGADSYGALSETAPVYEGLVAPSPLAEDSLYARGEPPGDIAAPSAMPPEPAASTTA